MNSKLIIQCVLIFAALLAFTACSKLRHSSTEEDDDVDYYTCAMHPSVRSHDPDGKCPICSMHLVPVMKKGLAKADMLPAATSAEITTEFVIPLERQQLIGVTYAKVEKIRLHSVIRAVGIVAVDKRRHWDYVARVDGYVHNLKVFSPGEVVAQDQELMDLYSPDLTATQNEYIDLLRMRDQAAKSGSKTTAENAEHLLSAARQRLIQWNLSDAQIERLSNVREPIENLPLVSPFHGVVQSVGVDQGRRVNIGDKLIDIADLTHVWIWTEFYQEELSSLKIGTDVFITSSAFPGIKLPAKLSLIDPFINEEKRTGRARIDVENPHLTLRPDMYVDVEVALNRGEGLAVPINAVLPTGKHNIVFVDKGSGKLEPRFIELAGKFGNVYAVESGLKEGERVVASANFLIDAEAKVQGALKAW